MNRLEVNSCEQCQDIIEAYLDGELAAVERAALEAHMIVCAACAEQLALGRRVRAGLDSLRVLASPPSVAAAALAYASAHPRPSRRPSWRENWKLALAGALAMVLVAITGYVGQRSQPVLPPYTRAELEQAHAEAKWALVFISQLSRKTTDGVRSEVLDFHVTRNLRRAIDRKPGTTTKENEHAS
ncbi:MAG TPA: zf-HC2 domain-containing protein [bacterium]|nr:zf-HC2 domain-containing protein [bacterium]